MHRNKVETYIFLWLLGGAMYYSIEYVFRGFSHWSMFVLGGICFLFFGLQGKWTKWKDPMWKQVLRCTIFVVSCEFITGIIVNKWFGWNVWDYSEMPFQLFGQICLPFAFIFACLSRIGIGLNKSLMHTLLGEEK